jgi:hypothetical protein
MQIISAILFKVHLIFGRCKILGMVTIAFNDLQFCYYHQQQQKVWNGRASLCYIIFH